MNIVITGAGKGIGLEVVRKFADNQHTIVGISRNIDKLSSLKTSDNQILALPFDLTSLKDNDKSFLELIESKIDHIDILINNAGEVLRKPFENIEEDEARKLFEINFFAPATLIRALMPLLSKSKKAHVINISSIGGFQGSQKFGGLSYYSASKAAIACLTECLAEEYQKTNISFNCLAFGAVQTEMLAEAFPGYKAPLTAAEMAEFVHDFALNGNKFFNGKILPVSLSIP
jgi:3-oxoacyl-[acyl-carrier protein] reductase